MKIEETRVKIGSSSQRHSVQPASIDSQPITAQAPLVASCLHIHDSRPVEDEYKRLTVPCPVLIEP